ncbi:sigma-70 family RNA polymerase sigma factor [Verrucomicrobiaceae bacterium N1E253]|uniref:RNA polymerase sigma factor n=1 Tax=Oceaniferula marina TaxID=2748318 RepID=A0A851GCF2_9BACT|nr:sigma-70 family RNA polymerase sigma factor [Oceaniferula marina]NWK55253.1 sigma-70 family RNA polymerase sigma factor [Oceaniferula marina]
MESSRQDLDNIKLSQTGDLNAFGVLVRAHEGWLRAWLRSRLADWTAADDLAQDTFVTAFLKIRDFRGEGSFEAWLQRIAHNHIRNYRRKMREEYIGGDPELQVLLATDDPNETVHGNASLDALHECLTLVAKPEIKLLNDRYALGKTLREVAQETGAGYSALTMKFHRLRQSLADCIETKLNPKTP